MSLYASNIKSLEERKIKHIFHFDNAYLIYINHELDEEKSFALEENIYKQIVKIGENQKLSEYEILLPFDIDETELKNVLEFYSKYLIDKDVTVGLISKNSGFLALYKELFIEFGVTFFDENRVIESIPNVKEKRRRVYDTRDAYDTCVLFAERRCEGLPRVRLDESFHDKFIRFLNESNKTNKEVYTKGGITRQLFSKILSRKIDIPTKNTIICLIIGMELVYEDAKELLLSGGYALSRSILFDSIVMKYLKREIFDLDIINAELYENNLPQLGWHPR